MGIHSEKCIVRQFHHAPINSRLQPEPCVVRWLCPCVNVTEYTSTNLDGTAHYTAKRYHAVQELSQATSLYSMLLYKTRLNQAQQKMMQSRDVVDMRGTKLLPA